MESDDDLVEVDYAKLVDAASEHLKGSSESYEWDDFLKHIGVEYVSMYDGRCTLRLVTKSRFMVGRLKYNI